MAFIVKFTMTRPSADVEWVDKVGMLQESDVGSVDSVLESNNGTKETGNDGDLTSYIIYTFPSQSDWQSFYNQALPIWNRNNLMNRANDAGISVDVEVLENT